MKHVLTLLLVACSCIVSAQSEYCLDGTVWDAALGGCVPEADQCDLQYDFNGDGSVGAGDLLMFLTGFGATIIDEDLDGVCDDIDECVGEYDECGVCNGPGAVYDCGCEECGQFVECGDPISYQGYDYATVLIGNQCWFAENLRNELYNNGDSIPNNLSEDAWDMNSGANAVYGEGSSTCFDSSPDGDACDEAWSLNEYGRLYNWDAVDDPRGLCPNGWHVPTDGEWIMMEMALGMSEIDANDTGIRGTDEGTQMKTSYGWLNGEGENGSNSSGFSGLPGGLRACYGWFQDAGLLGAWWCSDEVMTRWLTAGTGVVRQDTVGGVGLSVRCISDELTCTSDLDSDGICDDVDDCVGQLDDCGVCNGPGAVYDCGCEECAQFVECGDPVSYQGYDYATVLIGDQCWFAENLRNESYNNGDVIPSNLSDHDWELTNSGAVTVFGDLSNVIDFSYCHDDSPEIDSCNPMVALEAYGRLYNWFAVNDARGLCPSGWHVPTIEEWEWMFDGLGGYLLAGVKMKSIYGWTDGGNGSNSSGFSGLPGGYRDGSFFESAGDYGLWWSSSTLPDEPYFQSLYYDSDAIYSPGFSAGDPQMGFSVRCIQDTE